MNNKTKSPLPAQHKKALFFAGVGNMLELYDYMLFGIMLPTLTPIFFPASSLGLNIGYLGFAISFLITPLGAIFWGYVGDKFGRVKILRNSLLLMAVPSLGIGFLPTYHEVGILAPIMLFLLRVLQGFSASGETMSAKLYAMETLGKSRYGFSSGIVSSFGALGVLMATVLATYVNINADIPNLWRVPFFISVLLFIVGLLIRNLSYKSLKTSKATNNNTSTFKVIKTHPKATTLIFGLGAILGLLSYSLHVFLLPFLKHSGLNLSKCFELSIIGLIITAISSIVAGIIFDWLKDKAAFFSKFIITSALLTLASYYLLLNSEYIMKVFAMACLGSILGSFATIAGVICVQTFAESIRCRGLFFPHTFGVAIFGGLTPISLNTASNIHVLMPSIIIATVLLTILTIIKQEVHNVFMP